MSLIILAGDSFTGFEQTSKGVPISVAMTKHTWHYKIKEKYINVLNIGKGGINNVEILNKLEPFWNKTNKAIFIINFSHLYRPKSTHIMKIKELKISKEITDFLIYKNNLNACKKIIKNFKNGFFWTPFSGYEKIKNINSYKFINGREGREGFPNHLSMEEHNFMFLTIDNYIRINNGLN